MELFYCNFEGLVTRIKESPDYAFQFQNLADLVQKNLNLAEACELSRFTLQQLRLRCEESQDDQLNILVDLNMKRDQIDVHVTQSEMECALQCRLLQQKESDLVETYKSALDQLTVLEKKLTEANLKSQREQVTQQLMQMETLSNQCAVEIKQRQAFFKERILKLKKLRSETFKQVEQLMSSLYLFLNKLDFDQDDGELDKRINGTQPPKQQPKQKEAPLPKNKNRPWQDEDDGLPLFGGLFQQQIEVQSVFRQEQIRQSNFGAQNRQNQQVQQLQNAQNQLSLKFQEGPSKQKCQIQYKATDSGKKN